FGMGFFAPRISTRLLDEIDRLSERPFRAAEICRAIGDRAEEQGFRRPSYEQVRLYVKAARRRPRSVSTAKVLGAARRRAPGRAPGRVPPARLRHADALSAQVTDCYLETEGRTNRPAAAFSAIVCSWPSSRTVSCSAAGCDSRTSTSAPGTKPWS